MKYKHWYEIIFNCVSANDSKSSCEYFSKLYGAIYVNKTAKYQENWKDIGDKVN